MAHRRGDRSHFPAHSDDLHKPSDWMARSRVRPHSKTTLWDSAGQKLSRKTQRSKWMMTTMMMMMRISHSDGVSSRPLSPLWNANFNFLLSSVYSNNTAFQPPSHERLAAAILAFPSSTTFFSLFFLTWTKNKDVVRCKSEKKSFFTVVKVKSTASFETICRVLSQMTPREWSLCIWLSV